MPFVTTTIFLSGFLRVTAFFTTIFGLARCAREARGTVQSTCLGVERDRRLSSK
eukprot:COSAG01_NODE_967_length_12384_cov_3.880505_9_plen_54_part_00